MKLAHYLQGRGVHSNPPGARVQTRARTPAGYLRVLAREQPEEVPVRACLALARATVATLDALGLASSDRPELLLRLAEHWYAGQVDREEAEQQLEDLVDQAAVGYYSPEWSRERPRLIFRVSCTLNAWANGYGLEHAEPEGHAVRRAVEFAVAAALTAVLHLRCPELWTGPPRRALFLRCAVESAQARVRLLRSLGEPQGGAELQTLALLRAALDPPGA